ncbi:MAG: RidA family protein [Thermomicrobiales bacterium]
MPNRENHATAPRRAILAAPLALGLGAAAHHAQAQDDEGDAMDLTIEHLNPEGMHQNPAFSQAVVVAGPARTIYVGGQNAVNAAGEIVGKGDLAAQTEQVFQNLETVLAAAGATLHDIILWRLFVVEGQDLRPGLEVTMRHWGTEHAPPAITSAMVPSLANPDFLLELEAIAVVPG